MKNDLNSTIKTVLQIVIIVVIAVFLFKLFIYLLPIFLIGIGIYYLYRIFKQSKGRVNENKNGSSNRKSLKEEIKEAEVVSEKFDK